MEILKHHSNEIENLEPRAYFLGRGENSYKLNFIPAGFDIETYTQYKKDDKDKVISHFTNMYIAMFMIDDLYIECRTWPEVSDVFRKIEELFCNTANTKFLMFIHNQSFEFAFMARELEELGHNVKVFARSKRKPMKITIDDKIIILDSMKITGFSLAKLAENYTTTQKAKGDLDYSVPRNRFTKLDETETGYTYADVKILAEFALYYEEKYLQNKQLPMTQTMIANLYMKDIIKELKCQKDVYFLMSKIYPKSRQQYDYIMLFFQGAYTHGMLCNLFCHLTDGLAFDMQSQYPYVCMSKWFPMGKLKKLYSLEKIDFYLENYACLLDVTLSNVKNKYGVTILSKHKLIETVGGVWDNGRLYSCDSCRAFITNVDLNYLKLFYEFDIKYNNCTYAKRGYLPDYYRLTVAGLYSKKQALKGKEEYKAEYANSKASLNGESYGACVTKLNFVNNVFDHGWSVEDNDIDFNTLWRSKNKSPAWGVFITSWARFCVLSMVYKIVSHTYEDGSSGKYDYWYTDTDSIKCANKPHIIEAFDKTNKEIIEDNKKFINDLNLKEKFPDCDFSTMGIFDQEPSIADWKCLGSKKYLYRENGSTKFKTTVAGMPKGKYVEWCDKHGKDYIETFDLDNVELCDWESGKLCAYYEDEPKTFTVTDTQGNTEEITTQSYVSLIPTSFSIKDNPELIAIYNIELQKQTGKCIL